MASENENFPSTGHAFLSDNWAQPIQQTIRRGSVHVARHGLAQGKLGRTVLYEVHSVPARVLDILFIFVYRIVRPFHFFAVSYHTFFLSIYYPPTEHTWSLGIQNWRKWPAEIKPATLIKVRVLSCL